MPARGRDPWPAAGGGPGRWLRDHRRVCHDSLLFVSARIGTSLLVWLLVGIALALPAGLYLMQRNLAVMTAAWEGRPGFSVYFDVGAPVEPVERLAADLTRLDTVERVTVIEADEALAEFARVAEIQDALAVLEENPLPASLQVVLAPDASMADLEQLAGRVRGAAAVSEVVVERTWLERLSALSQVVRRVGLVLGGLFALGAVLVTASSVRLAMEAQLDELRVLKLVGATERYIRRPFLYYGALYGLGGALIAAMLISVLLVVIEAPLRTLVGSYGGELTLLGLDPVFLGGLAAAGLVLGVAGALVAARQRVRSLEIA